MVSPAQVQTQRLPGSARMQEARKTFWAWSISRALLIWVSGHQAYIGRPLLGSLILRALR